MARVSRAKAVKPIVPADPGHGVPGPLRASAIVYSLLRGGKVADWRAMARDPQVCGRVRLTAEQHACVEAHLDVVEWVRAAPKRVPYMCRRCGSIGFAGDTSPPSRCVFTLGCGGAPVKTPLSAAACRSLAEGPAFEFDTAPAEGQAPPVRVPVWDEFDGDYTLIGAGADVEIVEEPAPPCCGPAGVHGAHEPHGPREAAPPPGAAQADDWFYFGDDPDASPAPEWGEPPDAPEAPGTPVPAAPPAAPPPAEPPSWLVWTPPRA